MKSSFITLQMFALIGVLTISHASDNWTGDGGKGMSLTIYAPEASGLAENQKHLPALVQAEFVSNFSGYSAVSVLDWEKLEGIYNKLFSDAYDDNAKERQDFGQLSTTTHFMTGNITKTATGYHLQVSITKTSDKMTAASYSGTFSFWDLDKLTGIRRASLELLKKMGVTLTEKAQKELAGAAATNYAYAQTALAKGITAQRQGTEVAASSYYSIAAIFDPSMLEAVNRSSILNTNIASGSMGDNVRNDIQWRKQWVDRLTETEQFFDNFNKIESMPYTLFYSKEIKQGKINYQNETVEASIETYLYGNDVWALAIERTLQAVYDGLNATKRKDAWELGGWPQRGVTDLNVFESQNKNFSVVFELVNNQNKVIGKQTLQAGGSWGLNWSGRPRIEVSSPDRKTLNFQSVSANDITDGLSVRVATINGTDAETAAIDGVLQVKPVNRYEVIRNDMYVFERGEIKGFANQNSEIVNSLLSIPSTIWGVPVTSIGKEAFKNAKLISVTIPEGVTHIDDNAFENNELNSVILPKSVTSIGKEAFKNAGLKLNSVTIPESVTHIGDNAFENKNDTFWFEKGEIKSFTNNNAGAINLSIPSTIWRVPVASIGKEAFKNAKLISVTIPEGVTYIGDNAFENNQLTNLIIPNSVTYIGSGAFINNNLNITEKSSITIGANVTIDATSVISRYVKSSDGGSIPIYESALPIDFIEFYYEKGKKAGTYLLTTSGFGQIWIHGENHEEAAAAKPFNASSVSIFFNTNFVDSRGYQNKEFQRSRLNAGAEFEFISTTNMVGTGLFVGGGMLGEDIAEFIVGINFKKLFFLIEQRFAIPVSLGFAWHPQWAYIKNRLVTDFIDEVAFLNEPEDYLNSTRTMSRNNFDIIPAIDMQLFISDNFSIYAGYTYNISFSKGWSFDYKIPGKAYKENESGDSFDVPEEYTPLQNQKEGIFGVPGRARLGMKFHMN